MDSWLHTSALLVHYMVKISPNIIKTFWCREVHYSGNCDLGKGGERGLSTKSVKFQIASPGQERTPGTHPSLALARLVAWTLPARCDNTWRAHSGTLPRVRLTHVTHSATLGSIQPYMRA